MTDLRAKFTLEGDASSLKRALEEARQAHLQAFAGAKAAIVPAQQALAEAQRHAQRMAQTLKSEGKSGEDFARWMQGAAVAVRAAKDQVESKTLALQAARKATAANAAAIVQAAQAERAAEAQALQAIRAVAVAREDAHRRALQQQREEAAALAAAWASRNAQVQAQSAKAALVLNAHHGEALEENKRRDALRPPPGPVEPPKPLRPRLGEGMQSISTQLDTLQTLGTRAAVLLTGLHGAGELAHLADEYTNIAARIKNASASAEEFRQGQAFVLAQATKNGQSLSEFGGFYARTAMEVRNLGRAQADAALLTSALSDSIRISGASAAQASSAMMMLDEAVAAGQLDGRQMRSILMETPRFAKALADGMGVNVGQLKKLSEEGALSLQVMLQALSSQQGKLASEAAKMPLTIGGAFTNLKSQFMAYVGQTNDATGASRLLSGAVNGLARNFEDVAGAAMTAAAGYGAARLALALLQRQAAARAAGGAAAGLASMLGLAGAGPVGLAIVGVTTALTVGVTAWELWGNAADRAAQKALAKKRSALQELKDFAGQLPEAREKALLEQVGRQAAADEARLKVLESGPHTNKGGLAAAAAGEAQELRAAIEEQRAMLSAADTKARDPSIPLTKARGDLGLDAVKFPGVDSMGKGTPKSLDLVSKESADRTVGFSSVWAAFADRTVLANGRLKVSFGEAALALENFYKGASSSADFNGVIAGLQQALQKPGGQGERLRALLESALVKREEAQRKELDGALAGLKKHAQDAENLFSSVSGQARLALANGQAVARMSAELAKDQGALSSIDAAASRGAMAQARAAAQLKLEQLDEEKKRRLSLAQVGGDQTRATAGEKVAEEERLRDKRLQELAAEAAAIKAAEVAAQRLVSARNATPTRRTRATPGRGVASAQTLAQEAAAAGQRSVDMRAIENERVTLAQATAEKIKTLREAEVEGVNAAEKQKQDIERQSALARRAILEDLQKSAEGQASSALERYKSYAAQVIDLDKQIVRNRLDTAASINALQRRDMDPKKQAQSLRDEMAQVQEAANAAAQNGDRAGALDLLSRKKGLVNELASVKGDGIDPKAMKDEAIAALTDIGAQADGIVREQRAEAAAAANEQKAVYLEMTRAVQQLAEQIAKLNAGEAMKLKAEVDTVSLQTAVQQIRDALAKETFKINVTANGVEGGAAAGLSPAAIAGAGQAPTRAAIAAAGQVQAAARPSLVERAVAPAMEAQDPAKVAARYRQGTGSYGDGGGLQGPFHQINVALANGGSATLYGRPADAADFARDVQKAADMVGTN